MSMLRFVAPIVVVLAGCGSEKAAPKGPPPREIDVVTLKPEEVRDTGEYLGTLLSRESVTVFPQVAGYVRQIHVKPGAVVKAGAPLVDIDAREEAAALESAQANQRAAEARLELARTNLARSEALLREGLAPAQEVDQARADVRAAEAAVNAASAGSAQRSVQLDLTTVRAAVAGTVADVLVRLGDSVTPSTQLTTIVPDPDAAKGKGVALEVTASIPAERARAVADGAPLEILDEQGNVIAKAPIFYVAPQADPRTQLVAVKARFTNEAGLRPAEIVRVRVVYGASAALQVPASAVMRQSGQPFVFVVRDKDGKSVVERKPVTLGKLGKTSYVVEGGLETGDRVAVSSLQMLRDGAPVVPKEKG